jgi:hypothetical protein
VKRQKNDAADAKAICKAAQRPTMRFVAVKSEERQTAAIVFRTHDLRPLGTTLFPDASVSDAVGVGCALLSALTWMLRT